MTLLKEKMTAAGVDTANARLAALAFANLHEANGSIVAAVEALFQKLSNEPWLVKEALLKPYLIERQADMRGHQAAEAPGVMHGEHTDLDHVLADRRTTRRPTDPARKQTFARIVQSAVAIIRFKHLTSDGRDFALVPAYELYGMKRDGDLAGPLLDRLGPLSNEQTCKPLGELMTPAVFNEVRSALKEKTAP